MLSINLSLSIPSLRSDFRSLGVGSGSKFEILPYVDLVRHLRPVKV